MATTDAALQEMIERTIVTDWARVTDPSSMDMGHPITKDTLKGTLEENDPSFQFFSLFSDFQAQ